MKKNMDIAGTSARFLADEMNEKEKKLFLEQLKNDSFMQEEFLQMKETWDRFDSGPSDKYSRTGPAWNQMKERLSHDGLLNSENPHGHTASWYLLRVTAAAIVLALAGFGISRLLSGRSEIHYHTIAWDANHSVSGYLLPDGSRVFLNEGSEISLPDRFTNERTLKLEGEAYFNVTHDPAHPFTINAAKTVITVVGTSFNVKEYENDGTVEILVETGRVKVSGKPGSDGITLSGGQFGRSDGNSATLEELHDVNYLSWKTKEFRFVNEDLPHILNTLETAYHVRVDTGKVGVSGLKLTSTYKDQSFEAILRTICTAFNFSYEKTENVYTLTKE